MSQFLPLESLRSSNVDKKTHNSDPCHSTISECCEIKGGGGREDFSVGNDAKSASRNDK